MHHFQIKVSNSSCITSHIGRRSESIWSIHGHSIMVVNEYNHLFNMHFHVLPESSAISSSLGTILTVLMLSPVSIR
jgi:hypothetical protein